MSSSGIESDITAMQTAVDPCVARNLIKHENELINHRLTWFITMQGFLFASLGFAWGKPDAKALVFVFCGLGILSSISTAFALWGGAAAIERQVKMVRETEDVIGRQARWIEKVVYPWYTFPVLFAVAWGLIFWINR